MRKSLGAQFWEAKLARRRMLQASVAGLGSASMGMPLARMSFAADKPQLANSLRSLTNPYHASFAKGGEMFAKSVESVQGLIQACKDIEPSLA